MSQTNVNPNTPAAVDDASGAMTAASNNLTWAIAAVLIIPAPAIAIVYVEQNVHV